MKSPNPIYCLGACGPRCAGRRGECRQAVPEPPVIPAALPDVGIPSPRDGPFLRELQPDEMGLPILAAAAGLVLASLLPPSSAGKTMLRRRGLEATGSGALPGEGHSLPQGNGGLRAPDAGWGAPGPPPWGDAGGCWRAGERRGARMPCHRCSGLDAALWWGHPDAQSAWSRGISGYL